MMSLPNREEGGSGRTLTYKVVLFIVIRDLVSDNEDVKAVIENITVKTLILWGEHDKVRREGW